MQSVLWRGSWTTRTRIVTGLVLFLYALLHFINIGLGLFSPQAMEAMQTARQTVTRSVPGTIIIYGSLLLHAGLALVRVAARGTLRMPLREAVQLVLGLTIPVFLTAHIVFTRAANELFAVNDEYGYLIGLIWGSNSAWTQSALLLVVWVHSAIGLHMWLNPMRWWRQSQPWLVAGFVLVPAFALAGFVAEGRRISAALADPEQAGALFARFNWPDAQAFTELIALKDQLLLMFWALLALSLLAFVTRQLLRRRQSVRVEYVDGPRIRTPRGPTLLEMSRANGVPHTSLCGGRGRCTTCRVIVEEGADLLHPPSAAEAASLKAVNAAPNARLACQVRPTDPLTVFRVFRPDGRRKRAHASQGQEKRLAVLFLDMRGFTARTTGQLPYDVVFLLNRFFDAIVPAITRSGGTVDKYLGDGLLAVFETRDSQSSAKAGMQAAIGIGEAMNRFNSRLESDGEAPVRVGVGLHLGDVVLGEIGAAGNAPRTLIGDAVNTASRLESETKAQGVELLVSKAVLEAAGLETGHLNLIPLELRGLNAPLEALPVSQAAGLAEMLEELATT